MLWTRNTFLIRIGQTYLHLKAIVEDESMRPDILVANFFVDTAKDMLIPFNVPIAMLWPDMPYFMLPCSYISLDSLDSEWI